MSDPSSWPSVNKLAAPLVEQLVAESDRLRIKVERPEGGYRLIDAGIECPGGTDAGLRIAEICLAGLGQVELEPTPTWGHGLRRLTVRSASPVLACLGSQYAGWSLSDGSGKGAFHALGSGPGRALAVKEPLFEELGYRDAAETAVLVLEVGRRPPPALVEKIVRDCRIEAAGLTLVLTPTESPAGTLQIVARVLEVALHKLHELGFPLERVVEGSGTAPVPPPARSFLVAMGQTNDAIIYGGSVEISVTGPDDEARDLAERLPSVNSPDYGRPFVEIFQAVAGDFYAIDPLLFSPARVTVTALESGRSHRAGQIDADIVARSFG